MIAYPQLGLRGRLGNALFEFASTVGVARTLGLDPIFPADWLHRPYFSVPDEMFSDTCSGMTAMDFPITHHIDARARDYLQDVRLFWHCIDEIRGYLQPSDLANEMFDAQWKDLLKSNGKTPWLGLHVRRGDNVYDAGIPNKFDYHLTMSREYYFEGTMQLFPIGPFGDYYTVAISDDIPWCKENIPADYYGMGKGYWKENEERFGLDQPLDWMDLLLLSHCDYFVLGGSTFGIWGAILADVWGDCVIRPKKVYGPLIDYVDESLLFPADWKVSNVA